MAFNTYLALASALALWYFLSSIAAWHRLRHFPGPVLARFSNLHRLFSSFSGKCYLKYAHLGQTYDNNARSLIRIGPNDLITSDPDIIRRMSAARSYYRRSAWYAALLVDPRSENMISTLNTAAHDRLKIATAAGYGTSASAHIEEAIDPQVMALVDLLRRKYTSGPERYRPVEFGALSKFFALDVITRLAYDKEAGHLATDSDVYGCLEFFDCFPKQLQMRTELPITSRVFLSSLFLHFFGPKHSDPRGMGRLMRLVHDAIQDYGENKHGKEKGFVGAFLSAGLDANQCESEVILQLTAGFHTTAIAICTILVHILSTPRVYARLKADIAQAAKDGSISSPITESEAKAMPYVQAVILEGLRIHPPVASRFAKQVPPQGDTLQGRFIPGGTRISHNIWALMRDEPIFGPDVELFRPERFLQADPAKVNPTMQAQVDFCFGYGRWGCVGKHIARMELDKIFVELLRAFDIQLVYPGNTLNMKQEVLFSQKDLWIQVQEV
ncbi:hypothetical protein CDD81_3478 [Ophiocordyceps australis]|uniref:Cytochrome P450 n=1 Tax=Ophiocordyceps australis TaxID=1399860 RepID=A0A2C5YC91_9HYPO|nr:hypothetical protein CDD81_3478 [Ophiocordyceps australis]